MFDALTARDGQFRGFISNGERTFHAAAEASHAFAQAWRELPAFERHSQTALRSIDSLATDAVPVLDQFRPAEEQLTPLLQACQAVHAAVQLLLTSSGRSRRPPTTGAAGFKQETELTVPLLAATSPLLHNLDPFFQYLQPVRARAAGAVRQRDRVHRRRTKKTANVREGPQQHFLKAMQVLTPEGLAVYQQRIGTNRGNAYPQPGAFRALATGLSVFASASCAVLRALVERAADRDDHAEK